MFKNPFRILSRPESSAATAPKHSTAPTSERIERMVRSSEIVVLMKGSPEAPLCGFSANTIGIVHSHGRPYATFDVLADPEIRAAAKDYAQWPTFPQVYVRGEFIGGNDIVSELHASGGLAQLFEERS